MVFTALTITGGMCAVRPLEGRELNLPVYRFLKDPLIRRFGKEWYDELCGVADELRKDGYID